MAELAGRLADGVNLGGGPGLSRLLEVARAARAAAERPGVAPRHGVLRTSAPGLVDALEAEGVDRAVAFVVAPFADQARRLAARRA